jgi:hypothetical protein
MEMTQTFHAPTVPYGIVDALNRRAAATGSVGYAKRSSHADYNGHSVGVHWNDYRRYYIAEYTWSGRNVMARGTLRSCLDAALNYYRRGALGAKVSVGLREDDTEGQALCEATPELQPGPEPSLDWHTWRHSTAARCARDAAHPGSSTMVFDLELLEGASDEQAYVEALRAKHGHVYL